MHDKVTLLTAHLHIKIHYFSWIFFSQIVYVCIHSYFMLIQISPLQDI